jgi:hypothetical protein
LWIRKELTGDMVCSVGFNAVVDLMKKEGDGNNNDLFEHELIKNSDVLVSVRNSKIDEPFGEIKKTSTLSV